MISSHEPRIIGVDPVVEGRYNIVDGVVTLSDRCGRESTAVR